MVAVVILTYNAGQQIEQLLAGLEKQTLAPAFRIVIDSGSNDQTIEIAARYDWEIHTISHLDFDHGKTRNLAIQMNSSDVFIFLTQDVVLDSPRSLEELVKPFAEDVEISAVYGRQKPAQNASVFAEHLRIFNYSDTSHVRQYRDKAKYGLKTAFLSNSFAAYRKTDLLEIGCFKEGLIFGEDMYAAAKLLLNGKKIAYCAQAGVYHSHNYTIVQDFQRYFDMGVFHEREKEILRKFGGAGKEGFRYAKSEFSFLADRKQYALYAEWFVRVLFKWIGYRAGRLHTFLPLWVNKKIGLNHSWWDRE